MSFNPSEVALFVKRKLEKISVFSYRLVIVPFNEPQRHWYFAACFPQHRAFAIVDSAPARTRERAAIRDLRRFLKLWADFCGDGACEWTPITISSPSQPGGYECGDFVAVNVDMLLLGQPLTYSSDIARIMMKETRMHLLNFSLFGKVPTM